MDLIQDWSYDEIMLTGLPTDARFWKQKAEDEYGVKIYTSGAQETYEMLEKQPVKLLCSMIKKCDLRVPEFVKIVDQHHEKRRKIIYSVLDSRYILEDKRKILQKIIEVLLDPWDHEDGVEEEMMSYLEECEEGLRDIFAPYVST